MTTANPTFHDRYMGVLAAIQAAEKALHMLEGEARKPYDGAPPRERVAHGIILEANRLLVAARGVMLHKNPSEFDSMAQGSEDGHGA